MNPGTTIKKGKHWVFILLTVTNEDAHVSVRKKALCLEHNFKIRFIFVSKTEKKFPLSNITF